jgi:integrase
VTSTKSKRVRRVDLSDELLEALKHHRRTQLEEWLKRKKKDKEDTTAAGEQATANDAPPEWVFANQHGSWFDAANLREREFARCLEKAGLHGRRLHDLRHTYASILLTNGAPISYVSEQMGHRSIELTVKRYGHPIPGKNRHFVNALPGGQFLPAVKQA